MLKVSLIALAVSTWVFWSFVFATRPEEVKGVAVGSVDSLESLVRLPASLPSQIPGMQGAATRANDPIAMDVVNIPCWEKTEAAAYETSARWVRLIGRNCASAIPIDSVSVRNLSNGYVATIFPTENRNMTTDFIPLQSGTNDIQIQFDQGADAPVQTQLKLQRQ